MIPRFLTVLCLALFLVSCEEPESAAPKTVEYEKAKVVSDDLASSLLKDDVSEIYKHLDLGYQVLIKEPKDLYKVFKNMYGESGHPEEFEYKVTRVGTRVDGSWVRPCRYFWYAAKTKKYEKGKYFLKVEIVPPIGGGALNVSGFGLLTFKDDKVPSYLR